ncbi:MAG: hypothetical protein WDA24_00750 [Tissierellales bacterium]
MTETKVQDRIIGGCYKLLPNNVLFDLTHKSMLEIKPLKYTEEEMEFAKTIQEKLKPSMV